MNVFLIKIYDHIKSAGVFTNFFYNTIFGFNTVTGGEAARHSYCRINNIALAAGSFPFDDLNFITGAYKAGTFHFKFNSSHGR